MRLSDIRHDLAGIIDADRGNSLKSKIYDRVMSAVIVLSLMPLMFLEEQYLP